MKTNTCSDDRVSESEYIANAPTYTPKLVPEPKQEPNTQTILVVDDEVVLLNLVKELLESKYHVLTAENAEEAIHLANTHHFDLLLTDIVMEGMNGIELGAYLKEKHPQSKVLYMSGNSAYLKQVADEACLEKPWSPQGLYDKVEEVLNL